MRDQFHGSIMAASKGRPGVVFIDGAWAGGSARPQMHKVSFRKVDVDGFSIFYREAGFRHAPAILLLHGFPSAGHMFRDLIPQLADRFHVIAPDLPGFGQSDMPERTKLS